MKNMNAFLILSTDTVEISFSVDNRDFGKKEYGFLLVSLCNPENTYIADNKSWLKKALKKNTSERGELEEMLEENNKSPKQGIKDLKKIVKHAKKMKIW